MGAFDGYIPAHFYGGTSSTKNKPEYHFINGQSAFQLYPGFGIDELTVLLLEAENNNEDSVYIWVNKDKRQGQARLDTWYIRAYIDHYNNTHR